MNKRHYEHTLPNIRGSLSNTYVRIMKKEEETFAIRTYDKAELASLYCPGREPGAALQNLYRWIRRIPRLTEELNATGYNKYRHCYLKQEVEIIVKYLGEP